MSPILPDAAFAPLAGLISVVRLGKGQVLFRAGDPADALGMVKRGVLKSVSPQPQARRRINDLFKAGDIIGIEMAATHADTVEAVTECLVWQLPRHGVAAAARESQGLAELLRTALARQVAMAQQQLRLVSLDLAEARIASLLVSLSRQGLGTNNEPDMVWWPMSIADMGSYLSLTPETVSRVLQRLRSEGLIGQRGSGYIRLLDVERLAAIADG